MKKRNFRDFAGIFLIYALYATVMVWLYDPESFLGDDPPMWPIYMWIGSFALTLLWYVLGEWVIRPHAVNLTWYSTWFGLLALVFCSACLVSLMEAGDSSQKLTPYPMLHFVGGIGAYYLSSVLFSPLFGKYKIWPAGLVRKSW